MSDAVLIDASALLAVLFQEPGAEAVIDVLPSAEISAVNAAEVIAKLTDKLAENGEPPEQAQALFEALLLPVRAFGSRAAGIAGQLRRGTRSAGLSLGDRACLAEALCASLPVLTADRSWAALNLPLDIRVIRP